MIYTLTPQSVSQFDAYRFRLESGAGAARWLERPAHGAARQLVFRGLAPGRLYNLTMWTVSRNVTSHPVQRQARLRNYPLRNIC